MFRILSPPIGHPTVYEKFVMENNTKVKNKQKIFTNGFSSFQIHYFPKGLIIDKEELILDMDEEILSPRLRNFLS